MKDVISGLLASPGRRARAIVTSTGARYVVFCKGENEVVKYARRKPQQPGRCPAQRAESRLAGAGADALPANP